MKDIPGSGSPGMSLARQTCCQGRGASGSCLSKCVNAPCGRGRCDTESFMERDSEDFFKVHPQPSPPNPSVPLAPLRDDVPLTEPCSGGLSAAARADLRLGDRNTDNKPRKSKVKFMVQDNYEKVPSMKTRPGSLVPLDPGHEDADPIKSMDKVLRFIYTSATQRAFESIGWCSSLSPHLSAPLSIVEKMPDPVSQRFTLKRYNSRPELWQAIAHDWNRQQIRALFNTKKPFSFTSPCPKSGQIPLYSGVIGSVNMDNIDNPEKDFIPLTLQRTVLPADTPTAYRPTIPGYTGKTLHDSRHTSATSQPSSALTYQTTWRRSAPSLFNRQAPLARLVTTVSPGNPFLLPKMDAPPIYS